MDGILTTLLFDAQSSGGLVLAVPTDRIERAEEMLAEQGEACWRIGEVLPALNETGVLFLV